MIKQLCLSFRIKFDKTVYLWSLCLLRSGTQQIKSHSQLLHLYKEQIWSCVGKKDTTSLKWNTYLRIYFEIGRYIISSASSRELQFVLTQAHLRLSSEFQWSLRFAWFTTAIGNALSNKRKKIYCTYHLFFTCNLQANRTQYILCFHHWHACVAHR